MIDDRFTKGTFAGAAGALVQNIYAYFSGLLGFTDTHYLDVARAILFNQNFKGYLAVIVGFLGQLVIDSFWGVLFAFLIKNTSSRFYIYKGIVFSLGIWFLIRVIVTKVFGLPVLSRNNPKVALFFFIGASIFGLTISIVMKKLNKQNHPQNSNT